MLRAAMRLLCCAVLLLHLASCASAVPKLGAEDGLPLADDEKRIWSRSKELEERLDSAGDVYADPALNAYVNNVAQRMTPENLKQRGLSFRVKILKNPLMGAFALAHGTIYVHTGLLARLENEAQLATLLGHEMSHIILRHQILQNRAVHNAAGTLAAFQLMFMPFGIFGAAASLLTAVGATAAISGYSRGMESDADTQGLELSVLAGYDPREAPKLFDHLKKDLEASKRTEPFFFGNHPRLAERKDNYNHLVEEKYASIKGDKGAEGFTARIARVMLDNALFDMSLGRFELAQESIERFIENQPASGAGHFYLGELWRQKNPGDLGKAEKEYLKAIDQDGAFAAPYRGLGLIWMKQGQNDNAKQAFEKYLSLAPAAADKGYIQQYIQQTTSNGGETP